MNNWKVLPARQTDDGKVFTITGWVDGEHCNMTGQQNCRLADVYSIEANAHLIAAAPELLEACKTALRLALDYSSDSVARRVAKQLSLVIDKAEGGV